ncbi:MAG TPA: ArsR family transcriptional regulator [Candidatus Acidoferrales bacterium]|nr:ArsR family transcriptional regulator [Candidatus Acidoferrales bacterium]
MPKGFFTLFVFVTIMLVTTPLAAASPSPLKGAISLPSNDLQTRVLQDALGNVHVLWLVPALNNSATSPGIWYSKYTPNGTDTIPPTQVTNSSGVQSADLAVDENGNAVIVWADDLSKPESYSSLNLLRFNSTQGLSIQLLTVHGSLILWPRLALDNNDTVYTTWTEYNPANLAASVDYGRITSGVFTQVRTIASYERADAFPPETSMVFDNSSRHLQLAWGESEHDGQSGSQVNYAKLVSNGTILTTLQVAKFTATLRDVSMTATSGRDGAFVAWQTTTSNSSVYISQISANGQLVYVRQLNYTSGQSRYLVFSADPEGNIYVVWYQPSATTTPTHQTRTTVTSITYVRMNIDGDIVETWNGVVRGSVLSMAVSNDGTVYATSPAGLVRVTVPTNNYGNEWIGAFLFVSCLGVAGAISTEEGRYRFISLCWRYSPTGDLGHNEILRTLAKSPGLNLRNIRNATNHTHANMRQLVRLEKSGALASFRTGLSRKFYVKIVSPNSTDGLQTRILLWIIDHPGIWEARLSKDLGLSQQIVHYHLKKLRDSGLVTTITTPDGNRKLYRLAKSNWSRKT